MSKKRTHVAFVLDESGSMGSVRDQTIDGFNEQVEVIRQNAEDGGEVSVSLFKFGCKPDSAPKEVYFNKPLDELLEISRETYAPFGMTPMYDGVGLALNRLESLDSSGDVGFLVVVVSDGLENASKEWTASKLADRVSDLQDTDKWTFVYIGANQDLADVQKHLGMVEGNTMAYGSTPAGTQDMWAATACNTANYFNNVRCVGSTSTTCFTQHRKAGVDVDITVSGG